MSDSFPGSGTNLKSTFSVGTESALKATLNLRDEIHLTFHSAAVSQEGYD